MTVRVYRWDDAGAPELSGTAGALIALLDACLISGYGAKAASGWSKAYSGTNTAAYRAPVGDTRHYLRVDDTGTVSAPILGYEAMISVDSGTNKFPIDIQNATYVRILKSSVASTTARPWVLVATGRIFYLWVAYDGTTTNSIMHCFGEITSYKPGDAYHTILVGVSGTTHSGSLWQNLVDASLTHASGHYMARSFTQIGGSILCGKGSDNYLGGTSFGATGALFPDAVTGGLRIAPVFISQGSDIVRGELPGVWNPLHNKPLEHLGTFQGSGEYVGKTFLALDIYNASQMLFEISDTW